MSHQSNPIYQITGQSIEEMRSELEVILNSISNRLDAAEGVRGHAEISNRLDIIDDDGFRIHGFNNEASPKANE
jgi:hypothetical protein